MEIVARDAVNYCVNITLRSCDKVVSSSLILFPKCRTKEKLAENTARK